MHEPTTDGRDTGQKGEWVETEEMLDRWYQTEPLPEWRQVNYFKVAGARCVWHRDRVLDELHELHKDTCAVAGDSNCATAPLMKEFRGHNKDIPQKD